MKLKLTEIRPLVNLNNVVSVEIERTKSGQFGLDFLWSMIRGILL